jgi:hypothetical protein
MRPGPAVTRTGRSNRRVVSTSNPPITGSDGPGVVHHETHLAADQHQRPLALVVTPGQWADYPQFTTVLGEIRVPRLGVGGTRSRPDRILADEAHSSGANRAYLRRRGIKATLPIKADQAAPRAAKGHAGGRPPVFEPSLYARSAVTRRAG